MLDFAKRIGTHDRVFKYFLSNFSLDKEDYEALSFYVWQSSPQIGNSIMKEQVKEMSNTLDSAVLTSAFERMSIQLRSEGLAEGEARGLLRCVKITVGQPDTETEALILEIRDSCLIDACYDAISAGKIKNIEELKIKIQE